MGGDGRGQGLNKRAPSCAPWVTTTWLLWLVFCVGAVIFLTLLAEARTRRSYSAADPICRLSDRGAIICTQAAMVDQQPIMVVFDLDACCVRAPFGLELVVHTCFFRLLII